MANPPLSRLIEAELLEFKFVKLIKRDTHIAAKFKGKNYTWTFPLVDSKRTLETWKASSRWSEWTWEFNMRSGNSCRLLIGIAEVIDHLEYKILPRLEEDDPIYAKVYSTDRPRWFVTEKAMAAVMRENKVAIAEVFRILPEFSVSFTHHKAVREKKKILNKFASLSRKALKSDISYDEILEKLNESLAESIQES